MNLVIIGLTGSGYKKLAEKTAKILGRKYVNTDEVLMRNLQMPLMDYYTLFPVQAFNDLSTRLARQLSEGEKYVIAVGDSILTTPEAINSLKKTGLVLYYSRSPEDVINECDEDDHPLLARGRQRLFDLYDERESIFKQLSVQTLDSSTGMQACAEAASRALLEYEASSAYTLEDNSAELAELFRKRFSIFSEDKVKQEQYVQICLSTISGLDKAFS